MDLTPPISRILFVTPECAPLTKTGGLGDVSGALPAALRELGVDCRVLMPGYEAIFRKGLAFRVAGAGRALGRAWRLLESELACGVPLYLVDCPELYWREGGPYQDASGTDWADNAHRFGLFSRVAAQLGGAHSPLAWRPEVLHCNDWPAGLVPAYLRLQAQGAASLMTVHNLAFQGLFDAALLAELELPPESFSLDGVEFHGKLSFLKGGIAYADAIATVSPSYAREIQAEALGCGLDGLLRKRNDVLHGILNGIDTAAWDPATDRHLARRYDASTLALKGANKATLQARLGLASDPEAPLLGMVARFTAQKGVDVVLATAEQLLGLPAQLALLGQGERALEEALAAYAARHRGRMAVVQQFDEGLAHLIEAGADVFLMPSRFEPCGLNQMYSQRYGTPPVVHATGGLRDTVEDGVTGFAFEAFGEAEFLGAVRRAVAAYRDRRRWRKIQRAGMTRDFSWTSAARRYADLFRRLATPAVA